MVDDFELAGQSVWVPGAHGMVGSAMVRQLAAENVTLCATTRDEVDLSDPVQVNDFYATRKPDVVVLSAAKVGGIYANATYPAEFIADNLLIEHNVIVGAWRAQVKKLLFLGSSCIYPRACPQPIKEEYLLTGPLEPSNQWYAIAKIAGIKLCQAYRMQYGCNFISAMPTNLYGPYDNFHPQNSHVPAALLKRFHEAKITGAKQASVWGSGAPRREFLHVDDLAAACVFLLRHYSDLSPINVGVGHDISIAAFAELMKTTVGFTGELVFDRSHPDGTPRKWLDVSKITRLGWQSRITLQEGLKQYYQWYLENNHDSY